MVTESPIHIIEASGKWGSTNMGNEDLELALPNQRFQGRKSSLLPNRSGSAPPSIEGSFAAIENLMSMQNLDTATNLASPNRTGISTSEEQLRADPSYFEYYSAHVNLNPRLPPPLISGENRNLFRNLRGTRSNRRLTSFDVTSSRSLWLDHGNLSTHKEESDNDRSPKQDGLPQAQSPASNQSHLFIQEPNEYSNLTTTTVTSSSSIGGKMVIEPPVNTSVNIHSQDHGPVSGVAGADISAIRNGIVSLNISGLPEVENEIDWQQRNPLPVPDSQIMSLPQTYVGMYQFPQNPTNISSEVQPPLHSLGFAPPHYATDPGYMTSETPIYPNMMPAGYYPQQYAIQGYAFNLPPSSPYATGYIPNNLFPTPFSNMVPSCSGQSQTSGVNLQLVNNFYGHFGSPFSWEDHISKSLGGHINLNSRRVDTMNPYYFGSMTNMNFLQFPNSPCSSSLVLGSPIDEASRRNDGVYGGWKGHNGNYLNEPKTYSFLEELKLGRGQSLEIADISGHIVEFSVDQFGSRFIQQKLEVCSNEERESIFKEILPHAYKLTTDVFGNYVIQKIFEHGNDEQRREFGKRFEGQILFLSLQVYGCRVIQKAIEAFELEQKIKIMHELDGHVLKCIRDQNGNHVIQKCIEYLPTENIKIVVSSLRGQVVALSKHPYGCRVIQRVLEHSTRQQCQFIMDEILDCVYDLAQDQYGNYVIQYVLEEGKPEERSQIIHKLVGNVVKLSQHKYASNVIEKCLLYGDETARNLIIEEITEYANGNDNLLVLVKDQYANYVVQKVIQTSSGHQREVLLRRIKANLDSLKNYTYGKHIVARFEQLYGEAIAASSS